MDWRLRGFTIYIYIFCVKGPMCMWPHWIAKYKLAANMHEQAYIYVTVEFGFLCGWYMSIL